MKIEKDCAVAFDFTMRDEAGPVLDTSKGKYPYEYLHGYG
jgi:FKBP-type peptidyl-prolyl cis-trans isomerase 2